MFLELLREARHGRARHDLEGSPLSRLLDVLRHKKTEEGRLHASHAGLLSWLALLWSCEEAMISVAVRFTKPQACTVTGEKAT